MTLGYIAQLPRHFQGSSRDDGARIKEGKSRTQKLDDKNDKNWTDNEFLAAAMRDQNVQTIAASKGLGSGNAMPE